MFTDGFNKGLPWQTWVKKTVHGAGNTDTLEKKKFQTLWSIKEVMLKVFWNMKRPITIDFFEKGATVNRVVQLISLEAKFPLFIEWLIYIYIYIYITILYQGRWVYMWHFTFTLSVVIKKVNVVFTKIYSYKINHTLYHHTYRHTDRLMDKLIDKITLKKYSKKKNERNMSGWQWFNLLHFSLTATVLFLKYHQAINFSYLHQRTFVHYAICRSHFQPFYRPSYMSMLLHMGKFWLVNKWLCKNLREKWKQRKR